MVNFWATWCAPCRREIPLLNKIRVERKAQNAEIVGIAVDFRDDVLKFVQKTPLEYPLLIGEEDGLAAAEAFGMGMAFPVLRVRRQPEPDPDDQDWRVTRR